MKEKAVKSHSPILFSILSGVMLTASFPPGRLEWMAWFALVPLLKAISHAPPGRAFKLGFVAGFAHFLTLIYWVMITLQHYGRLNALISISVLLLFCAYLSLYPALFAFITAKTGRARFSVLLMATTWVALELTRAKFLSGFPWCLLGYSQYRHLFLIQVADLVGVYGISFLIVLANGMVYTLLFRRPALNNRAFLWEGLIILSLAGLTLLYGRFRLQEMAPGKNPGQEEVQPVRVAVIQANIDQSVKWNPEYQDKTLDTYARLTRFSLRFKPRLIVWPETAVPFFFQNHPKLARRILAMLRGSSADLIFGSPAFDEVHGRVRYYNRAYHLSSDGVVAGYYDKVHLVPFGEYVPFKKFLPFINRLVVAAGDFASGKRVAPITFPGISAGVLICFEAIFPELARLQTREGAEILVNLTNDAWFGMTHAPYQHLSMAVFRAVENRRPLVRAANTGISAFIGPKGDILMRGELFTEAVLTMDIEPLKTPIGFYTKHGDLFALILLITCLINIFHALCYHHIAPGRDAKTKLNRGRKNRPVMRLYKEDGQYVPGSVDKN